MGSEIRRVPAGWEHPKDAKGDFKPLYDRPYAEAAEEYLASCIAWHEGTSDDAKKWNRKYPYWWEWVGDPPDRDFYRPEFDAAPTHYQVYEPVSEGNPTSPVFTTLDDMKAWLIRQDHSEHAASEFVKYGWAPSLAVVDGKVSGPGIDSLDAFPPAADSAPLATP